MANTTEIIKISVRELRAPLIRPFRTALGQHDTLDNLRFEMRTKGGLTGRGEAAIATHITGETLGATRLNLQNAGSKLLGRDITDYLDLSLMLKELLQDNPAARAAIECALLDALSRHMGMPLWAFYGPCPKNIQTDITLVIAGLEETLQAAKEFYRQGFRKFKVKIGNDQEMDIKRVLALSRAFPRAAILLDANQGYTAAQTIKFLGVLKKYKLKPLLIEQPVPKGDWEGLREVSRSCKVTVCADESVGKVRDCLKLIKGNYAGCVNIKLMKSGLIEAREIALLAKRAGLELMIGAMMESSLSITAAAHFACGSGIFDHIDLDTPFFIKPGYDRNPYLRKNGIFKLSHTDCGIGRVNDDQL